MNSKYSKGIGLSILLLLVLSKYLVANLPMNDPNFSDSKMAPYNKEYVLKNETQLVGIDFVHTKPSYHPSLENVSPMLTSLGASASVVDYNNDGFMDFYVTSSSKTSENYLYVNQKDGTFKNLAREAQIAFVNGDAPSLKSLFFDFDNDGDQDLYLHTTYCDRLFRNDNSIFVDVTQESGLKECAYSMASNVWDMDLDGDLDLIVASYFKPFDMYTAAVTDFMPESTVSAENGGVISVYENIGKGHFKKVPDNLGIQSSRFVFTISIADFRNTNARDIWLGVDWNADRAYLENSKMHYTDITKELSRTPARHSMNGEVEYIDNDDYPTLHISQVHLPERTNFGNQIWKWQANSQSFREEAAERGEYQCGWSWGGKFVDVNNDSELELIVANGFYSYGKEESSNEYWYHSSVLANLHKSDRADISFWFPMGRYSQGGFQRNCFFRKVNGFYAKDTESSDVNRFKRDARSVSMIDYLNNGKNSVIVTNQGDEIEFLVNESNNDNNWVGFSLIGTKSNRDAIGSKVKVYLKDRVLTKAKYPANGFVTQNDPRLHFGIPKGYEIEKVEVTWPNFETKILSNIKINQYNKVIE